MVRFTVAPVAVVPMTISEALAFGPAVVSVCEAGTMESETSGSDTTLPTVRVAVAVTTPDPALGGFV